MGALMRGHDWSRSPLGEPDGWPDALKSSVSICLNSRFPMVLWWGPEFVMLYNDAWRPVLGASKHPEGLGRPGVESWPEIWDIIGAQLGGVLRGEASWSEDLLLVLERFGYREEAYFTYSYSPIKHADGSIGGVFSAVNETTQRVLGERRLGILRELAEQTADAKSVDAACSAIAKVLGDDNPDLPLAALYLVGDDRQSALRLATSGFGAAEERAPRRVELSGDDDWKIAEVIRTGRATFIDDLPERVGKLPGGAWPEPTTSALVLPVSKAGQRAGTTGALVAGINSRRALDDQYRGFLDLVAGHMATAVSNARAYEEEKRRAESLAELDRAKTAFFSNVSHEFRTPLTLLLSPIEEMLAKPENEVFPDNRALIEVAHRNALRLLKLVNTLLDFARIEAGRVQASFEPVDLSALTADLASNFRSATEKAGLRLVVDCPPLGEPVFVDSDMWEKIVLNLLSNAFKFTFEGSISVQLTKQGDDAELLVADTGTGIPVHELPFLFDRFHRIEGARGRSHEGSGIGLALVQELVKLHGGSIRAESEEGRGTTFIVTIPFGAAHLPAERTRSESTRPSGATQASVYIEEALRWLPEAPAKSPFIQQMTGMETSAARDGAPANILVADDNSDMRQYVHRLLSTRHAVKTVADGQAALEEARRERPDLILTDVMMPRLDGFGLLRAVREDPSLRDLPVVVLSARAGQEASVEAISAGADDYLVKPFAARELLARVEGALALSRLRREASRTLRESEERFRNMADNAPVMMWITDPTGYCTYLNRRWYEFTGQNESEALGFGWLQATHPDDMAEAERIFLAANERHEAFQLEYRLRRADGVYRWAIDAASPRIGSDGEFLGYIGSVIDITQRKEAEEAQRRINELLERRVAEVVAEREVAEEQLRQAQKMEAIGHLTGGIAHDFNNLLTIVIGNIETMQRHFPGDVASRFRRSLENAMAGARRAATLTQHLLAFSRRQPLAPKPTDLNKLVAGLSQILGRTLGERIDVQTVLAAGLWQIEVDQNQLESALINLALNARDAMPDGGKLTIETANAFLDEAYAARVAELVPGQYVVLAVSDSGSGISRDVLDRVFEPFFTTKPVGHGTGLGLSQVYGFVKQSGGHVKIYSEPNQGTTAKIYLPRHRGEVAGEDVARQTVPDGDARETILVVEDDDGVREYTVEILRELGYRVIEASGAVAALGHIESGGSIDLLFTDVGLADLNGRQLADQARRLRPGLKVLFTTGYARNAIVHHGRLDADVHLIGKPFTYADLAERIRTVLDE